MHLQENQLLAVLSEEAEISVEAGVAAFLVSLVGGLLIFVAIVPPLVSIISVMRSLDLFEEATAGAGFEVIVGSSPTSTPMVPGRMCL